MKKNKYGFSGGDWEVIAPEGDDGYHDVSIGDSDEWTDVTFYGVKAKENAHLFKSSPKMYKMLESISELLPLLDEQTHPQIELDALKSNVDNLLKEARGE